MVDTHNSRFSRDQKSDVKFVEWSKSRSNYDKDIQFVVDHVRKSQVKNGLDVGGGIGQFAAVLCAECPEVNILILDPSVRAASDQVTHQRTKFLCSDLENFTTDEKFQFITVNLVLHHIIGKSEKETKNKQTKFINKINSLMAPGGILFIQENIYESYFLNDLSGWIIFQITKLRSIETITRRLGANTAGEGVRFHSDNTWLNLFSESNFKLLDEYENRSWGKNLSVYHKVFLFNKARYQKTYVLRQ